MQLNATTGWLEQDNNLRYCVSPFYNQRPNVDDIDLLVIHNISLPPGEFGTPYVDELFTGCLNPHAHPSLKELAQVRVSSHFLIDRKGRVRQYVSVWDRAWHAGRSSYQGRENCNDFSIGIELEGSDYTAFTENQYRRLSQLCSILIDVLPNVTPQRITGHSDIAPGRKTDPGPYFDWKRLQRSLSDG